MLLALRVNLRFDVRKKGSADQASAAEVYLNLENGAVAPAPCALLVIWNHAIILALRVNLRFDRKNGVCGDASAAAGEAYSENGALAPAPCIFLPMV